MSHSNNSSHKGSPYGKPPAQSRPVCTQPGCGLAGHYSDTCWTAYPHLRPHDNPSSRLRTFLPKGSGLPRDSTRPNEELSPQCQQLPEEVRQELNSVLLTTDDLGRFCDGGLESSIWAKTPNPLPPLPANTPNSLKMFQQPSQKPAKPISTDHMPFTETSSQIFPHSNSTSRPYLTDNTKPSGTNMGGLSGPKKSGLVGASMRKASCGDKPVDASLQTRQDNDVKSELQKAGWTPPHLQNIPTHLKRYQAKPLAESSQIDSWLPPHLQSSKKTMKAEAGSTYIPCITHSLDPVSNDISASDIAHAVEEVARAGSRCNTNLDQFRRQISTSVSSYTTVGSGGGDLRRDSHQDGGVCLHSMTQETGPNSVHDETRLTPLSNTASKVPAAAHPGFEKLSKDCTQPEAFAGQSREQAHQINEKTTSVHQVQSEVGFDKFKVQSLQHTNGNTSVTQNSPYQQQQIGVKDTDIDSEVVKQPRDVYNVLVGNVAGSRTNPNVQLTDQLFMIEPAFQEHKEVDELSRYHQKSSDRLTKDALVKQTGVAPVESKHSSLKISDDGVEEVEQRRDVRGVLADKFTDLQDWDGSWAPPPCEWENDRQFCSKDFVPAYIKAWIGEQKSLPAMTVNTQCIEFSPLACPVRGDVFDPVVDHPTAYPDYDESDNPGKQRTQTAGIDITRTIRAAQKRERNSQLQEKAMLVHSSNQNIAVPEFNPNTPLIACWLRPAHLKDAQGIAGIYNHYIATSIIPENLEPVTVEDIRILIRNTQAQYRPFIVAIRGSTPSLPLKNTADTVLGFSYIAGAYGVGNQVSGHSRHTGIVHFYTHKDHTRKGVGRALLDRLLQCTSTAHGAKDGYDFVNPKNDPVYHSMGGNGPRKFHQLVIEISVEKRDDMTLLWLKKWIEGKFYFFQVARFINIGRTSDNGCSARWLDRVIFHHSASREDEFI